MASEGPRSPGTVINDPFTGDYAWANPGNAGAHDDVFTVSTIGYQYADTHELVAYNWGFSIPSGATIDGIKVEIERKASESSSEGRARDSLVSFTQSGDHHYADPLADNKADTGTNWPLSEAYATYGGAGDTWGRSWTSANINDSDFGVLVQARSGGDFGVNSVSIDHVRMTIYYTEGGAEPSIATSGLSGLSGMGAIGWPDAFGRRWG